MRQPISVIIPQFERSRLSVQCVETLWAFHRDLEVIVVDDGSSLSELKGLRQQQNLGAQIVRMSRNSGVTQAWNRGADHASGDTLIFLNNDTLTTGTWCEELANPVRNQLCSIAGIEERKESRIPENLTDSLTEKRILAGWCFALSRDLFFELGKFDERFRLYFSDTDLQLRVVMAQRHTTPLLVVPELPVSHAAHQTTKVLPQRSRDWHRDCIAFERKWMGQEGS